MKSMCRWCHREPHKPHLDNCPELTGVVSRSDPVQNQRTKRKSGAYLRRGRNENTLLPHTLYLAETHAAPDSPQDMYEFMESER